MSTELMNTELIAIISVGVGLAGLILAGQHSLRAEIQNLREKTEARFEQQQRLIMQLAERVARLEGLLTGVMEQEIRLRHILAKGSSEASGMVEGVAEEGRQYGDPKDKQD